MNEEKDDEIIIGVDVPKEKLKDEKVKRKKEKKEARIKQKFEKNDNKKKLKEKDKEKQEKKKKVNKEKEEKAKEKKKEKIREKEEKLKEKNKKIREKAHKKKIKKEQEKNNVEPENDSEIIVEAIIEKKIEKKKKPKKIEKNIEKTEYIKPPKNRAPKVNKNIDRKNKARIQGNSKIFRNRILRRCMLITLVCICLFLFFMSSLFNITNYEILNNNMVTKEDVISLLNISDNTNIFKVKKNDLKNLIKENSYVEDVIITRKLPGTLKIDVNERKVNYMIPLGESFVYVNKMGYILTRTAEMKNLPILIGIVTDINELQKGKKLDDRDIKKFENLNRICDMARNNGLLDKIKRIDISNSKDYLLHLDDDKKIIHLGDGNNLNIRFLYVKEILEQEEGVDGEIFVNVDLNTEKVYFRENI